MITIDAARRHSDADLLSAATRLAAAGREVTADLVALLAVLVERGLYAGEGYGSAHDFCVGRLCLSDAEAYHRLAAAQVAARFPPVLEGLRRGALTLTNVALLRPHLTEANAARLLAWAEGRRKHEVEREIRRLAPRPDVAASLRRLPVPASPARREVAPATGPLTAMAGHAIREVASATGPLTAAAGPAMGEVALAPGGVPTPSSPALRHFTAEPFPTTARLARPDVAPGTGPLSPAASPARREVALAPEGAPTPGSPALRHFTAEPFPTTARLARPDVAPSTFEQLRGRVACGSLLDPADETRGVEPSSVAAVAAATRGCIRRRSGGGARHLPGGTRR